MTSTFGVGMIGQGFMGKAHADAWQRAPRFFDLPVAPEVRAVAARDRESLGAFAERWGIARAVGDWRELIADPDLALIDVATPNHLHAEQAIAALEAGKHVACEKPLAATLGEARRMRDAARAAPEAKTFVWFNYRRAPAIGLARQLVLEGRLGEIRHVRARYLQSWGGESTPMSWRFRRDLAGSGAHGDLNAHAIDLARFLLGDEPASVEGAIARTFVDRRMDEDGRSVTVDVDDALAFLARFEGGAIGTFEASRCAAGHLNENAIEIDGSKGSLRWCFEDMNVLWLFEHGEGKRSSGFRRVLCTDPGLHPWAGAWWAEGHVLGYEHGFVNMAADVARALGGGEPEAPLCDFEDAYRTQCVLEAALRSASERRPIALAEIG